jgi:hypothetical protein
MGDKRTNSTSNYPTTQDQNGGKSRLKGQRYRWMMHVKSAVMTSFYEAVRIDGIQLIIADYWGPSSPSFDVTHVGPGVILSEDALEARFAPRSDFPTPEEDYPGAALGAESLGKLCYDGDETVGEFSVCLKPYISCPSVTGFYVGVSRRDIRLHTQHFEIGVFAAQVFFRAGRFEKSGNCFTAGFSARRITRDAELPERYVPCVHHGDSHFTVTVRFDLKSGRLSFMIGDKLFVNVYGTIDGLDQMYPYVESTRFDHVARFISKCQVDRSGHNSPETAAAAAAAVDANETNH